MTPPPIHLVDSNSAAIAELDVRLRDDRVEGTIDLRRTPPALRKLFDEFEAIVEGQMFGLLDEIEAKIAANRLRAAFADGTEAKIADLQVFPSSGAVSFATLEPSLPPNPRGRLVSGGVSAS